VTRRRSLQIPPLRFGAGRECTLLASLAAATGADYDWLMGCSGAAFTTTLDLETWDPLAAAPHDDSTLARAARAAGVRVDRVTPPFDDEMRELVFDRLAEAIEAKLPPLVRGIVGPPEFGLLVGYEEPGPTFLARTYFDHGDDPTKVGWDAFAGPARGEPFFLDRTAAPSREELAREALGAAIDATDATEAATQGWINGLRDDARWADARRAGTLAFADHAMRSILADKRRAATRFLRAVRGHFPPRAGADLLRAAEAHGHVADAAEKAGVGPFDASVVARYVGGGQRRAWANLLEGALAREREAHAALRAAAA